MYRYLPYKKGREQGGNAHETRDKSKIRNSFSRDQLVNTATVARHFGKVKIAARVKPLFITDNGER